jgi:hypothetical protein
VKLRALGDSRSSSVAIETEELRGEEHHVLVRLRSRDELLELAVIAQVNLFGLREVSLGDREEVVAEDALTAALDVRRSAERVPARAWCSRRARMGADFHARMSARPKERATGMLVRFRAWRANKPVTSLPRS